MAEATARHPGTRGGWGKGLPVTRGDLLLVQRAASEAWPVAAVVRQAVVADVAAVLTTPKPRLTLSAARCVLAMDQANIRHEAAEQSSK